MLKSLCSAFLMYSRIPVPQVEWNDENKRYALCFFPVIGLIIGALLLIWGMICVLMHLSRILFSVIAVCIPLWITGGIHLDGFCDVTDAKNAFASPEKRLEIMKDPHIGAFAVMHVCMYLLLQTGLFSQIADFRSIGVISCGCVLSRVLSALAAVSFRSAKKNGTLQSFVNPADKDITISSLLVQLMAVSISMIFLSPLTGMFSIVAAIGLFFYYQRFAYQYFNGITGDLSGWFLQICELGILAGAVLSEVIFQ